MDLDSYFDSLGFDSSDIETHNVEPDNTPQRLKDSHFQFPDCLKPGQRLKRASIEPLDHLALEHATYEMRLLFRQLDQPLLLPTELPDTEPIPTPRRGVQMGAALLSRTIATVVLVSLMGGLLVIHQRRCEQAAQCWVLSQVWEGADRAIAQSRIVPVRRKTAVVQPSPAAAQPSNAFREAVNQAMRAAELTQTAKTAAEWNRVAYHWLRAIEFMRSVPPSSPRYRTAVQKAGEYARNLTYAQHNVERVNAQD